MPEIVNITIDDSIPVKKGQQEIKVKDYATTPLEDSQFVHFFDGDDWDIEAIRIKDFHEDTKKGKGEDPDEFHFDLSGFDDDFTVDIDGEFDFDCFIIQNATSFEEDGGVYAIEYTGSDGESHTVEIDPGDACLVINPPCLTPGTLVSTPGGWEKAGVLKVGDLVDTADGGPQPLCWVNKRRMVFSGEDSAFKPIFIEKSALGPRMPLNDLYLSPQHRVLLDGPMIRRKCGSSEVLVSAKALTDRKGIRRAAGAASVEYITLMFKSHQIIFAEGVKVESYLPRPYALDFLTGAAADELQKMFPGVFSEDSAAIYPSARPVLTTRQALQLTKAKCRPELFTRHRVFPSGTLGWPDWRRRFDLSFGVR
jgi:Hint domain-containing protein